MMQWIQFVLLMLAVAVAVSAALGSAMRLSGLWRGGLRDLAVSFGLGWLGVVLALLAVYAVDEVARGTRLWNPENVHKVIMVIAGCAVTVPVIGFMLRKRGPGSYKAGVIFAFFMALLWGGLEILDKITGQESTVGHVEHVDDDGTIWLRLNDGSVIGQRPIGYDEDGKLIYESVEGSVMPRE